MKKQSIYADPADLQQKNLGEQTITKVQPLQKTAETSQKPPQPQNPEQADERSEVMKPQSLAHHGLRPERPDQQQKSIDSGDRQMKPDLSYTAVMKKKKDMDPLEAKKKVAAIEKRSDNVLMKIKAVFPFDFFPNTVIIDANKVTIIDALFFASESVISILLEEITDVTVDSNFFLAKLNITYSHHPLKPEYYSISALRKKEAIRAKEIIQGLLVLRISEGIDLSKLKPDEIIKQLEGIGKTHENLPAL